MQRQRRRGQAPGAADRAAAGQWRCAPVGGNGKAVSVDWDIARPIFPGGHTLCMWTAYAVLIFRKEQKALQAAAWSAFCNSIIPYQELLGNYNKAHTHSLFYHIIPYQELLGNYNHLEQQRLEQSIIPYQELLGNYNWHFHGLISGIIIPYQELLGNYNLKVCGKGNVLIIPYQELLGNYNILR